LSEQQYTFRLLSLTIWVNRACRQHWIASANQQKEEEEEKERNAMDAH